MFPTNFIAGMFGFKKFDYFKIDEKEKVTTLETTEYEY